VTDEQVAAGLIGSDEFYQKAGSTNDGFLNAVYTDVLNRQPDASGRAYWDSQLTGGTSRAAVALALLTSQEAYQVKVASYYQRFLHRVPASGEGNTWVSMLQHGGHDEQVIANFVGSDEYFANGLSAYLKHAYQDLLGRTADPSGLAYWRGRLQSGTSPSDVATGVMGTSEYQSLTVSQLYTSLLNRSADAGGLQYWVTQLQGGVTDEQVAAGLIGSDEFYQKAGSTNDGFLNALYSDVLHRQPDSGGRSYWDGQLSSGTSRTTVVYAVLATQEAYQVKVATYYQHFLRRAPDAAGAAVWVHALGQGVSDEQVIAIFVSSDEYIIYAATH
jgi:hypothetical protein